MTFLVKRSLFQTFAAALCFLGALPSFAAFNQNERSINGTADTLGAGKGEIGFATLAYGVTDSFQIRLPTLPLIAGSLSVLGEYKFELNNNFRITPYLGAGVLLNPDSSSDERTTGTAGAGFGFDFGDEAKHSLAFSLAAVRGPKFTRDRDTRFDVTTHLGVSVEYDYYTDGGNLFYAGLQGIVPYFGYTWAWEHFHMGLVSSLATVFIPAPYLYWRF